MCEMMSGSFQLKVKMLWFNYILLTRVGKWNCIVLFPFPLGVYIYMYIHMYMYMYIKRVIWFV